MKTISILLSIFTSLSLFAHGGVDHSAMKKVKVVQVKSSVNDLINKSYVRNVKPIFQRTCFNCHSSQITYPWYYKIPGIKQIIDYDTREAKKHLDLSNDYPFISHETPVNDLKSIKKSIEAGDMPPLKYSLFHSDAKISKEEIETINKWISYSLKSLK